MILSPRSARRLATLAAGLAVAGATALFLVLPGLSRPAGADQPQRGGTVTAALVPTEPAALAIVADTAGPTVIVSTKMFEGLVALGPGYAVVPELAQSWTLTPDGRELRFALRDGVRWHDGRPFTSADVKYSLEEVWKKFHPRGRSTFANVESVETPDPLTAVFKLTGPADVLFAALTRGESPVLPRHLYEGSDPSRSPHNLKPVGTGPFRFKEWVRGDRIELERNPDYWDAGKPHLDRLVFRLIPDAVARAGAFEVGNLQYGALGPVSLSDLDRLRANPALVVEYGGYEWLSPRTAMEFNLRRPLLQDVRVRRAIAHAIDLKTLAKVVMRDSARPATGAFPSTLTRFFTPDTPQYDHDPKAANDLLDAAGHPRGADGVRFSLTLDPLPFGENFTRTAEFVRQSLKRVGIAVEVRNQDLPRFFQRVYGENDFDLSLTLTTTFGDPQIGIDRLYWSKTILKGIPWTNASGYSAPEADRLIAAAHAERDPEARIRLYKDLQVLVRTDLPLLPLTENRLFTVHARNLHGMLTTPDGSYESLKDAWLER